MFGVDLETEMGLCIATLPREHREKTSQEIMLATIPRADVSAMRRRVHDAMYERNSCKDEMRARILDVIIKVLGMQIAELEKMHAYKERGQERVIPTVPCGWENVGLLWMNCMNWAKDGMGAEDVEAMRKIMKNIEKDIDNAKKVYRELVGKMKDETLSLQVREEVGERARMMLFRIKRAKEVYTSWGLSLSVLEEEEEEAKNLLLTKGGQ